MVVVQKVTFKGGNRMKKIQKTFKKNGFEYTLLKRVKNYALYQQYRDFNAEGSTNQYEVHKVSVIEPSSRMVTFPGGRSKLFENPEMEVLATKEKFGDYGWHFKDKKNAEQFMKEMKDETR